MSSSRKGQVTPTKEHEPQTLREARESRGFTQKDVAIALNVSLPTYIRYEENPEVMPVFKAKAVCKFIGCDIRDIFFSS